MAALDLKSKHNMIANLKKTPLNIPYHGIIDFLSGSSISYALIADPELIRPWLEEFWQTATEAMDINDNPVIHATVEGYDLSII